MYCKSAIDGSACLRHISRLCFKCDGTRAETRFRLSAKRTSPFKSAGVSFQSTTGSRGVRISSSSAGYTMFRGSVKCTGYPLHSPVTPSLPLPCVTVCHHISTGLYLPPNRQNSVAKRGAARLIFTAAITSNFTFNWSYLTDIPNETTDVHHQRRC